MALTTPYARSFYTSDGATSIYNIGFDGINKDFIRVHVKHTDGTIDHDVNVDVPLQTTGHLFGTVIFPEGKVPEMGAIIMIERRTPASQDTDYARQIQFDASAIDYSFDKLQAQIQEMKDHMYTSMVSTSVFQEEAINLDLMTQANHNQYLQLDFEKKIIKGGLFMELTGGGRYRVSHDNAQWTYMPHSVDVQEMRQVMIDDGTTMLEYRVGANWYSAAGKGISEHNQLKERDIANCHPIAAITQLQETLDTKAIKETDFQTAITEANKGITQAEYKKLDEKIDTAQLSGTNIGSYWFGKTNASTVVPAPTIAGQNYYDFTTGKVYNANESLTGWTYHKENQPPVDIDVNIVISAKFWDIPEQNNQQGGLATWSHTNKSWGYAPRIVSFENAALTGIPTAPTAEHTADPQQVANLALVKEYYESATEYADMHIGQQRIETAITVNESATVIMSNETADVYELDISASYTTAAAITVDFQDTANAGSNKSFTYELHVKMGAQERDLTWAAANGTIKWLFDSQISPSGVNCTHIFVFRHSNGNIIANYAGTYNS